MAEHRTHDLLPWYVNGTLSEEEVEEVEAHLTTCESCATELAVLEQVGAQVAEHGAAFFEAHPRAEDLVAFLVPAGEAIDGEQAHALRRHLAVCATCAEEAGWIRGEASAGGTSPVELRTAPVPAARPKWRWMAAAAGILLVGVALALVARSKREADASAVIAVNLIPPTQRGDEALPRVEASASTEAIHLLFEVDLPPEAFPVSLQVTGPRDDAVFQENRIEFNRLFRGQFLFVRLRNDEVTPGTYRAAIRSVRDPAQFLEFSFIVPSRSKP